MRRVTIIRISPKCLQHSLGDSFPPSLPFVGEKYTGRLSSHDIKLHEKPGVKLRNALQITVEEYRNLIPTCNILDLDCAMLCGRAMGEIAVDLSCEIRMDVFQVIQYQCRVIGGKVIASKNAILQEFLIAWHDTENIVHFIVSYLLWVYENFPAIDSGTHSVATYIAELTQWIADEVNSEAMEMAMRNPEVFDIVKNEGGE